MRTSAASAVMFALAVIGCGGDSPTVTFPDSPALSRGGGVAVTVPRPIQGHCQVTFTVVPSAPPLVSQVDGGMCRLSHLGASSTAGSQTINFATLTQVAERSFTAANGDVLRATSAGTSKPGAQPGTIDFDAMLTIVGGTGRFANATGQVHDWGTANLVTHAVTINLDGWLAYDASDRSDR